MWMQDDETMVTATEARMITAVVNARYWLDIRLPRVRARKLVDLVDRLSEESGVSSTEITALLESTGVY